MQGSNITIGIAFVAGILSFLSPCVLPLVPGYVSLISGVSIDRLKEGSATGARRAVVFNSLAFNVGLSMIFLALGTTAGVIGGSILTNPGIRIIGGIIGLAATSGGWRSGLLLSAFYSAGLAVPFLLTGLSINQFLGFYSRFRKHLHKVEVVSGVVLIVVGLLVASGYSTMLASSKLAALLPNAEGWIKVKPAGNPIPYRPGFDKANLELAPDVQFQTLAGKPFHLSEARGHV